MPCNEGGPLDLAGAIRLAAANPGGKAQLQFDVPRRDRVPGRGTAGIPPHLPGIPDEIPSLPHARVLAVMWTAASHASTVQRRRGREFQPFLM
jgi:hypothetical protein